MDDQQRIRQRAHELWEQEGRPSGRDKEHWMRATRELGFPPEGEHISVVAGEGQTPSTGGSPVTPLSGDRAQEQSPYASVDPRTERTG